MELEQIKALFPLEGIVTQKILDEGMRTSITHCYGALCLKSALKGTGLGVVWGGENGLILQNESPSSEVLAKVTTIGAIDMMRVEEATKVTFILRD